MNLSNYLIIIFIDGSILVKKILKNYNCIFKMLKYTWQADQKELK